MRLKYVGQHPTTFRDAELPSGALVRVGYLSPGDEFGVPDEIAEPFLRRADIIEAPDGAPPEDKAPRKVRSAPPEPEAAPEAPTAQAAE